MILIERTHCLEGIHRSLFRVFSWYWPFSMSLQFRLITCCWSIGRSSSIAQLSGFWNTETSFALALRSCPHPQPPNNHCWNLENISAAHLCGNAGLAARVNFWQHGKCMQQLDVPYDSNHVSCWNNCTAVYALHASALLPCDSRLNLLRCLIIMSAANTNLQSYSVFYSSGCGGWFLFRRISFLALS